MNPTLPQDITEVLASNRLIADIGNIAEKFSLPNEKALILYLVTTKILKGEVAPKAYVPSIATYLKIDQDQASGIAQEVNQVVFTKIKESLKKVHHIGNANDTPAKADAAPTTNDAPATTQTTNPAWGGVKTLNPSVKASPQTPPPSVRLPGEQNKAVISTAPPANIFEQKLSGTFRAQSESAVQATSDPYREPII